jgi:hypothetical protein
LDLEPYRNPCVPSPCGPNSICKEMGDIPSCTCMSNYIGNPPNCRPECIINSECPTSQACIQQKCRDPCLGSCGIGALCTVSNHVPICTCPEAYTGDAFTTCTPRLPGKYRKKFHPSIVKINISELFCNVLLFYFRKRSSGHLQSIAVWLQCCL